jgi:hypothetical protein
MRMGVFRWYWLNILAFSALLFSGCTYSSPNGVGHPQEQPIGSSTAQVQDSYHSNQIDFELSLQPDNTRTSTVSGTLLNKTPVMISVTVEFNAFDSHGTQTDSGLLVFHNVPPNTRSIQERRFWPNSATLKIVDVRPER